MPADLSLPFAAEGFKGFVDFDIHCAIQRRHFADEAIACFVKGKMRERGLRDRGERKVFGVSVYFLQSVNFSQSSDKTTPTHSDEPSCLLDLRDTLPS